MYISSKGEEKDPAAMESKYLVNAFEKSLREVGKAEGYSETAELWDVKNDYEGNPHAFNNVTVLKEELLKRLYPRDAEESAGEEKGI